MRRSFLWCWLLCRRVLTTPIITSSCDKELGHLFPVLFIIGGQKCGSTSLFSDLVRRGSVDTACKFALDPKECNVFTTHTTIAARSDHLGKLFCRPGGNTHNYCKRLRARTVRAASYFLQAYDACYSVPLPNDAPRRCQHHRYRAAAPLTNKTDCAPMVGLDASPTYLSRPHVSGTLRSVLGYQRAPRARFLISVRNPTTRTVSYFNHGVENNWANLGRRFQREAGFSFGKWVLEEIAKVRSCLQGSLPPGELNASSSLLFEPLQAWPDCGILGLNSAIYASQLEMWLRYFTPRQFLILSFERYTADDDAYEQTISDILNFIGAPTMRLGSAPRSKRASFSHKNFDAAKAEDLEALHIYFAPHNERLRVLLERHAGAIGIAAGLTPQELVGHWKV